MIKNFIQTNVWVMNLYIIEAHLLVDCIVWSNNIFYLINAVNFYKCGRKYYFLSTSLSHFAIKSCKFNVFILLYNRISSFFERYQSWRICEGLRFLKTLQYLECIGMFFGSYKPCSRYDSVFVEKNIVYVWKLNSSKWFVLSGWLLKIHSIWN